MLDLRREPLPRIPALYFCAPSAESIQLLVNESPKQYKEFHLFFTHRVPDFQMSVLRQNASMIKRVKNFVELDVELLALESRVFSLDRPGASIPQLYSDNQKEGIAEMSIISERLTETCTLVCPEVDWEVRADSCSSKARTVASLVKEQLCAAQLKRRVDIETSTSDAKVEGAQPHDESSGKSFEQGEFPCPTRATLLVLDRASDLISPLMHEFTYQAMAHDVLSLDYRKPGGAHFELAQPDDSSKTKSLPLDDEENDVTWTATRHLFIEEARGTAQAQFKDFLETDAAYKLRGKEGADLDIQDMSAAVRSLPDSQKRADRYALHITAIGECFAQCSSLRLQELAVAEQDIAIGRRPDGARAKPEEMIEVLSTLVRSPSINLEHRMRLLLVALAVAEGTVALGGEASLLALTSVFKLFLSRSDVLTVEDIDSLMSSSIKGFQKILSSAHASYNAFLMKAKGNSYRSATDHEGNQAIQLANALRSRYKERREVKKKEKKIELQRLRRHGRAGEAEVGYDVARYLPPLVSVALDLVDEKLDPESFAVVGSLSADTIISSLGTVSVSAKDKTSNHGYNIHRNTRTNTKTVASVLSGSAAAMGSIGNKLANRGKSSDRILALLEEEQFRVADREHLFVIFIIGGVTYSEVRSAYDVCARREANILVGGSQILTPHGFLEACAAVADPVVRMKVMLPPLPIELAQSRAARERTLKAGGIQKLKSSPDKDAPGQLTVKNERASANSVPGIQEEPPAASGDHDVIFVTGYEKKSMARKLFGKKR